MRHTGWMRSPPSPPPPPSRPPRAQGAGNGLDGSRSPSHAAHSPHAPHAPGGPGGPMGGGGGAGGAGAGGLHEKSYAFVEFRSVEEASNAMALDGVNFRDSYLKVGGAGRGGAVLSWAAPPVRLGRPCKPRVLCRPLAALANLGWAGAQTGALACPAGGSL